MLEGCGSKYATNSEKCSPEYKSSLSCILIFFRSQEKDTDTVFLHELLAPSAALVGKSGLWKHIEQNTTHNIRIFMLILSGLDLMATLGTKRDTVFIPA